MEPYPDPPPPYHELDPAKSQYLDPNRYRILRKPVSSPNLRNNSSREQHRTPTQGNSGPTQDGPAHWNERVPPLPPRPGLSLETSIPASITDSRLYDSPTRTHNRQRGTSPSNWSDSTSTASSLPPSRSSTPNATSSTPPSSQPSPSSYLQTAYREARHFAGGLIQHPSESTKHYSILRHSHGLVFYKGNCTSLAISIFADTSLPLDRTLWLQSKGWSGKTGMRARAFMGRNSDWLNVGPTMAVGAEQVKQTDERAWQRDIAAFQKNASNDKRRNHTLRETTVIRIPIEAGDGYFQLVLCLGDKKKVLCSSPTFRVFSTSVSPHSIKGASLATLPFEIGAVVASTYAQKTIGRVIGPVATIVQNRVQKYMPNKWIQEAATKAYDKSGASDKLKSTFRDGNSHHAQEPLFAVTGNEVTSLEHGPRAPYPVVFDAQIEPAIRINLGHLDMPVFDLVKVPSDFSQRLHGYYFGWCRIREKAISKSVDIEPSDTWCQAVISALPADVSQLSNLDMSNISTGLGTKIIRVHVFCDSESPPSQSTVLEVRIMGFIRPDEPFQRANIQRGLQEGDEAAMEAAILTEANDASMAQGILDHPAWSPDTDSQNQSLRPRGLERATKSFTDIRMAAQRQVGRVPTQLGFRMPEGMMGRNGVVINGYYIPR